MITLAQVPVPRWLPIPIVVACLVAAACADESEKLSEKAGGVTVPEPPMAESERSAMLKEYSEMAAALNERIKSAPESIGLYSQRGDCYMFLGEFEKCEADYEKMIALDPQLFAPHWRLGIAYYYTGKFEKSAKQFEAYHGYNDRDRENGIWEYMARAHVTGLKAARATMLKYELFDREPFPQMYAMFEGKDSTGGDGILKEINEANEISDTERQRRLFFAQLYVGIYKELTGDTEAALDLLRAAAASKWGQTASGGPTYMWQVARLHFEQLVARVAREEIKALPDEITEKAEERPGT
jgi:lipoprotein NlpI